MATAQFMQLDTATALGNRMRFLHLDDLRIGGTLPGGIGPQSIGGSQNLAPELRGASTDHQRGAFRHERAVPCDMVDVVMGQNEVLDRLVRKPRAHLLHDPLRVAIHVRGIEDDEERIHLHDQGVMDRALHLNNAGSPLHKLQLHPRRIVREIFDVVIGPDQLAPQYPEIRDI